MSIIQGTSKSSAAGYEIEQSIRFNDGDTPSLSRTIGTPTSTQKFTFSTWIKPCTFFNDTASRAIFSAATPGNSSSDRDIISWENDALYVAFNTGSWAEIKTNQVFRDPASWYHIVVAMDTTQSTASNRTKIYVNGSQVSSFSKASYVSQNDTIAICTSGKLQAIGAYAFDITAANDRIDGYLAEINFIDGQQLAPTSFGETNSDTGQWVPVKYAGSYGDNGYYLKGQDSSALGDDTSGNGNDFTSSGLAAADQMSDSPTDNFTTFNPIGSCNVSGQPLTISDGNLRSSAGGTSNAIEAVGTIAPTTGKYYAEFTLNAAPQLTDQYPAIGIIGIDLNITGGNNLNDASFFGYLPSGNKLSGGSSSSYGDTYTNGDIIGIALDLDNQKIYFSKNGTYQNSGDPAAGSNAAFTTLVAGTEYRFCVSHAGSSATDVTMNAGQSAFNTAAPTGFSPMSTANLPDPAITDPKRYFGTLLYTGNGTTGQTVTGLETTSGTSWTPDWVWIKPRSQPYSHQLFDAVRGAGKNLQSNNTNVEGDITAEFIAFADGGFQVDDNGSNNINQSGVTHVAWNWEAGGSGSSNTDGTVGSTVSASATSGFSIVKWTHTTAGNYTVGHGLGAVPKMILVKTRDQGTNWGVYHSDITAGNRLILNTTSAQTTGYWGANTWNSTVFSIGSVRDADGSDAVAYCFAEVEGFSKIGSYTGNGSTDGPFINLGFKPSWVMFKRTNSTADWMIKESSGRDPFNVMTNRILANTSFTDDPHSSNNLIDFVSNGMKHRMGSGTGNNAMNTSGSSYVYMAFAESPFKTATAR